MFQARLEKADSKFSLSVIMPAYNVAEYIGEAINSVLSQTLLPDELIIVNDGSTDATRDVISRYENHPIIKVIDKKNEGLGPARNTGIEHASANYLYFFDSDDVLDVQFVEWVSQAVLKNCGPDVIFFSGESFRENCAMEYGFKPPQYKRKVIGSFENGMELYRALLDSGSFVASACLYITRKSLWDDGGLRFKKILHEDEEIIFPLLVNAKKTFCTDRVFFYRRIRPGSIMTSMESRENVNGVFAAIRTMMDLKESQKKILQNSHDLWLSRLRVLTLSYYRRLLRGGFFIPDPLMFWILFRFGDIKTILHVLNFYRKCFFKKEEF